MKRQRKTRPEARRRADPLEGGDRGRRRWLAEETRARRKRLMTRLGPDSVAIVAAAPPRTRSGDTEYPYRQDSDFHYLTGFGEPRALLVLLPGREEGEAVLFCRERDRERERWTGPRTGPAAAPRRTGVDRAYPVGEFDRRLPALLRGRRRLWCVMGRDEASDRRATGWFGTLRSASGTDGGPAPRLLDLAGPLHELRLIKSRGEIRLMERAALISGEAHRRAMASCRPGMREYELEAELLYAFARRGGRAPAYNPIVAAGGNACVLHYDANAARIGKDDLVLIDAGCEYGHYASDITRTFPACGRFTPEQRAVYQVVLDAQRAAIRAVRPGAPCDAPHRASVRAVTRGLLGLGLLKGRADRLIAKEAYRPFYMHRAGHWLGMDVHDAGRYRIDGRWRPFRPGMVTTVEPGVYIAPDNAEVPARWRGIGVRIEDEVLVTRGGHRVLSEGVPKTVSEIESFMAGG